MNGQILQAQGSRTELPLSDIKAVLFDLDGVLFVGDRLIDRAVDVVAAVKRAGIARRFITNTSTLSQAVLLSRIRGMGFDIASHELLNAPQATAIYIRENLLAARIHFLVAEDVKGDFAEFQHASLNDAECIVIGDIGNGWTAELLNRIFNRLVDGARLIAIHRNRFWQTGRGLRMDIGGFVAALEYCSGAEALVMGKPSATFFDVALTGLGLEASAVAIVGDDIYADIEGGQRAGIHTVLVRTGKYRPAHVATSGIFPDHVIDSVADVPGLLDLMS